MCPGAQIYEQQLFSYFADIFISLSGIFGDLEPDK